MIRLNKYLAECGVGSRRKCDQFILEGKVSVNGVVEKRLGTKIDKNTDKVRFSQWDLETAQALEYYIFNKPKGVVTTVSDEKSRKTVLDYVKSSSRIYPVGRLDIDTTGLLLLTNDGALTYRLTHPKFHVKKIYNVFLDSELTEVDVQKLESGVRLEEGVTSECDVRFIKGMNRRHVQMTIYQGWKRQIRRMFAVLGYEVKDLKRSGIAFLQLDRLRAGEYRKLTKIEVNHLKRLTEQRAN